VAVRQQRERVRVAVWIGLLVVVAWPGPLWAAPPGGKAPKAQVKLVASVRAVAPGASFEVAFAYELADEWHTYWKNAGDSGKAPGIAWQLPPGFVADELRFPAPHRLVSGPADFQIVTYVLDGEPVLLARLTAPSDLAPGGSVRIGARVTTLVCKENCLVESQTLSLELPVVAEASAVQPANPELFERAAGKIPPADGRGKFVTVSAAPSVESIEVGGTFEVAVTVDIRRGYHIQSNRPTLPGLIPTEAIPEPVAGLEFEQAAYPKAKERIDKNLGKKLSEFDGKPVIRIPVEVTDEAFGTSLELAGIVIAQACEDRTGRCYPPEAVAWSTSLALVGAPATPPAEAATAVVESDEPVSAAVAEPDDGAGEETAQPAGAAKSRMSLPVILLFGFLGGVILNVMPCVWPVISIKVLSFVQQAHDDPKRVLRLGLLFALGILVSFWLLGLAAVAGKAAAGGATWGTQFADPRVVVAVIVVLYVFGLSLFGVFEINLPGAAAGTLSAASTREGYLGSYVKGMLATVLATPCTAPLLGPAIAVAFTQSSTVIMLAMTAIGLGMGLPYVVLAAKPAWLGFLPKPGAWVESFKQLTGFFLMGTVIFFLWVLGDLMGASGLVATAAFLTFLGLACWLYGKIKLTWSFAARMLTSAAVAAIALFGGWFAYGWMYAPPDEFGQVASNDGGLPPLPGPQDWDGRTPWVRHRPGLDKELASLGYTVFVNYTATWCTKCQIEKVTILETDAVQEKMRELGVIPLKADFTRRPDWLAEELKSYGRAGVPFDVIVPAGQPDQPIIMGDILTKSAVLEGLDQAGPSRAAAVDLAAAP